MIKALEGFAHYDIHDKFQILEDITPPGTTPSSPVLSASPGLGLFDRLRLKNEVDDCDECSFIPCASSTPEKSPSSYTRSVDSPWRWNLNRQPMKIPSKAQSAKRVLNWKGLAVSDNNVARPKRFRFEQHCVDYERIENKVEERLEKKKQEGRREDSRIVRKLEKRYREIDNEIRTQSDKLASLKSTRRAGDTRSKRSEEETKRRIKALLSFERVVLRRIDDAESRMRL